MPGVLQVEALAQVGGIVMLQQPISDGKGDFFFGGVDKVKWRKPVLPGDTLVMEMTLETYKPRFGIAKMEGKYVVLTLLLQSTRALFHVSNLHSCVHPFDCDSIHAMLLGDMLMVTSLSRECSPLSWLWRRSNACRINKSSPSRRYLVWSCLKNAPRIVIKTFNLGNRSSFLPPCPLKTMKRVIQNVSLSIR